MLIYKRHLIIEEVAGKDGFAYIKNCIVRLPELTAITTIKTFHLRQFFK